jgi:DNA-binding protein Fis
MPMKAQPANQKKAYVNFRQDLDRALEVLLNKAQGEVTDVLRHAFTRIVEIVAFRYTMLGTDNLMSAKARHSLQVIDQEIERTFQPFAQRVLQIMTKLKAQSYTLSLVGETEAIGRAKNQVMQFDVKHGQALQNAMKGRDGTSPASQVQIAFDRIRRKVLDAVEMSMIQGEDTQETLERVIKALPKKRLIKKPKRSLKPIPLQEADKPEKISLAIGFVSDEEWAQIVDDYTAEYIPTGRGPETVFDLPDPQGGPELEERYGWEIEQEMTDSFVNSVRSGQNEAANQLGITDFVWIALVDDKTDECCTWRDGLTSEEIKAKLKGEHKNDECEVIVPPAHFNCRCTMAPMLKDMPDSEPSNAQDFEDWLNS